MHSYMHVNRDLSRASCVQGGQIVNGDVHTLCRVLGHVLSRSSAVLLVFPLLNEAGPYDGQLQK